MIITTQGVSQNHTSKTVFTSINFFSSCVQDTFVIDVSLPRAYGHDTTVRYPLLILTDGNWRRPQHAAIHTISDSSIIKKLVVVGISYPDSYDVTAIRRRDFLSGAPAFLCFIVKELLPYLNARYRLTDERALWGSSLGGYFVLYTLFQHPTSSEKTFTHIIAASPAVLETTPMNDKQLNLLEYEALYAQQTDSLLVNLFIAVGSDEDRHRFYEPFLQLVQQLSQRNYKGLNFIWKVDTGKNHFTVWEPTLYKGLETLLKQSDGGNK